jgi:hypothetical protein
MGQTPTKTAKATNQLPSSPSSSSLSSSALSPTPPLPQLSSIPSVSWISPLSSEWPPLSLPPTVILNDAKSSLIIDTSPPLLLSSSSPSSSSSSVSTITLRVARWWHFPPRPVGAPSRKRGMNVPRGARHYDTITLESSMTMSQTVPHIRRASMLTDDDDMVLLSTFAFLFVMIVSWIC